MPKSAVLFSPFLEANVDNFFLSTVKWNMPVAYSTGLKPVILASDPLLKEGGSRCAADG
jgi:hypothetical protein